VFANSLAREDALGTPTADTLAVTLRALSWPGIELRHLTALCGVAAERSFVRAATRLGYTQSAVSQQIAALERAVGHRLVERTHGRGPVELTPAGRVVVQHAEAIARELSQTRSSLGALEHGSRELVVGIHRMTGLHLLPEILGGMQVDETPRLRIYESADERYLHVLVSYDELDVAFVHLPAPPDLESVELVTEEYVAVAAGPLADELGAGPVDATTLGRLPLLILGATPVREELDAYFESAGISLSTSFEGEDPSMLFELAERGRGVALVPRSLAVGSRPGVRIFSLRAAPTRRLGIVWREEATRARHLREPFVAAANSVLRAQSELPLAQTG
jgi:DNA-binding transcriptional LysR family regulator